MSTLIVVNNPKDWPLNVPDVEVVPARAYLTEPRFSKVRSAKVFNLCRSYRYQTVGYYVSLLAEARGHKPLPSVTTMLDMKSQHIVRFVSEDLDDLIGKSLAGIRADQYMLSIYFGRNVAKHYNRLSLNLFKLFPSPFLRAHFVRSADKWRLEKIAPIAASEIPPEHHPFVIEVATEYFSGRRAKLSRPPTSRYDLAILYNPAEKHKPSNDKAIQRFIRAAESLDMGVEVISREDFGRIVEFDALFIRETTSVNHHTYRFARKAAAEGLVVIDDPESILKCTNKVYLAEVLERHKVPAPKTVIVHHRDQIASVIDELGLPCILKKPDSSFSLGVTKAETATELKTKLEQLLDKSDLVIAQQFMPTRFDWRVGVFDGRPLYVCKYHMARNHWQIIKDDGADYGEVESLPIDAAPPEVIRTAVKAAGLIGDGLYGVDLKEIDGKVFVIEINDNPNIDAGFEDQASRDELYLGIMRTMLTRIERKKERRK